MRGVLGPLNSGMLTNNVRERQMRTSAPYGLLWRVFLTDYSLGLPVENLQRYNDIREDIHLRTIYSPCDTGRNSQLEKEFLRGTDLVH